ncbi:hypothetical protein, partial [Sphingomonas sp.]|uniref:hypothetical protein n=1 Tax=Sphingomonas sp. TaxID=28214 RepID=UPI00257F7B54
CRGKHVCPCKHRQLQTLNLRRAAYGVLVNQGLRHRSAVVKGRQFTGKKTGFRQALGRAGQRAIDRSIRAASAGAFQL